MGSGKTTPAVGLVSTQNFPPPSGLWVVVPTLSGSVTLRETKWEVGTSWPKPAGTDERGWSKNTLSIATAEAGFVLYKSILNHAPFYARGLCHTVHHVPSSTPLCLACSLRARGCATNLPCCLHAKGPAILSIMLFLCQVWGGAVPLCLKCSPCQNPMPLCPPCQSPVPFCLPCSLHARSPCHSIQPHFTPCQRPTVNYILLNAQAHATLSTMLHSLTKAHATLPHRQKSQPTYPYCDRGQDSETLRIYLPKSHS